MTRWPFALFFLTTNMCIPWRGFRFQEQETKEPPHLEASLLTTELVLMAGESWQIDVSVDASDDVQLPISFRCEGGPPGVTCTAGADGKLIVNAANDAPSTPSLATNVYAQSADEALSASTTLLIGIAEGPRLSFEATHLTINRGKSANAIATLHRTPGIDGAVSCTPKDVSADVTVEAVTFAAGVSTLPVAIAASGSDVNMVPAQATLTCTVGSALLSLSLLPRSGTIASTSVYNPYGIGQSNTVVEDMVVAPDGSVLLAGSAKIGINTTIPFVFRAKPSGGLDSSFSHAVGTPVEPGYALPYDAASVTNSGSFARVAIDSKGRIVACMRRGSTPRVAFTRLSSTGVVDGAFAASGNVVLPGADPSWPMTCAGVHVDANDHITMAVRSSAPNAASTYQTELAVITMDESGAVLSSTHARPFGDAMSAGERDQLVLGYARDSLGRHVFAGQNAAMSPFVARLTALGALDTGFNGIGARLFSDAFFNKVSASASSVWFLGYTLGVTSDVLVTRMAGDGSLALSGDGTRAFDFFGLADAATAALPYGDNGLTLTGRACDDVSQKAFAMRLREDGALDPTFGDPASPGRRLFPAIAQSLAPVAMGTDAAGMIYVALLTHSSAPCAFQSTVGHSMAVVKLWP